MGFPFEPQTWLVVRSYGSRQEFSTVSDTYTMDVSGAWKLTASQTIQSGHAGGR